MAKKYKLGIIDEFKNDRDLILSFFYLFDNDENNIEAVEIELSADIHQLVQNIIDSKVDAVAIDFNLKEYTNMPINFQGNEVFKLLQDNLLDFPAFILTNYTKNSEKENPSIDDFVILSKEWFAQEEYFERGKEYSRKIKNKIEKYKRNLREKEDKLIDLHTKQMQTELTLAEQTELIELDEYLERATGGKSFLPKDWKKPDTLKKFNDLADLAEKLLADLRKQ
jgi:hypothetical protein